MAVPRGFGIRSIQLGVTIGGYQAYPEESVASERSRLC